VKILHWIKVLYIESVIKSVKWNWKRNWKQN